MHSAAYGVRKCSHCTMALQIDLSTSLQLLAKDPLYYKDKPYTLHRLYSISILHDNFIAHLVDDVNIRDLRAVEGTFPFDENGIGILEMQSNMTYDDFSDSVKMENIYCKEVGDALLQYTQALSIQIFDFAVRSIRYLYNGHT